MRGFRAQVDRLKRDVRAVLKPDLMGAFIIAGPKGKCLLFVQPGRHGNRFSLSGNAATCFYKRWKAADEAGREALIQEATESQTCCERHPAAPTRPGSTNAPPPVEELGGAD
jgi:hypothetical protein